MPVLGRRGRLRGVVSEADLIREMVPADPRAHEVPTDGQWHDRPRVVADVMTAHAVTVNPETDLARGVELITTTTVKSVPVVDHENRVVGMLSRSDVVRVLARGDDDLARDVDAMLASLGLDGLGGRGDRRHRRAHRPGQLPRPGRRAPRRRHRARSRRGQRPLTSEGPRRRDHRPCEPPRRRARL